MAFQIHFTDYLLRMWDIYNITAVPILSNMQHIGDLWALLVINRMPQVLHRGKMLDLIPTRLCQSRGQFIYYRPGGGWKSSKIKKIIIGIVRNFHKQYSTTVIV